MKVKFTAIGLSVAIMICLSVTLPKVIAQHRRPPKEAIEACIGKREGDPCQFEAPHRTVYGTCRTINGRLTCVPDRGPDQGRGSWNEPGRGRTATSTVGSICRNPKPAVSNIVDTGQNRCYGNKGGNPCPKEGDDFYGQDAHYQGLQPSYKDNGNGTVIDINTGLTWQKTPDFVKRTMTEAEDYAESLALAGYDNWRLPTIKELFSIADFRGNMKTMTPYINTDYFDFTYPNTDEGWRIIDAQYRSSNRYVGITMRGDSSAFGFNFADGRIKSYPLSGGRGAGRQYVRCVRGPAYGNNDFVDNGDSTITDRTTGLMWMKADSGKTLNWQDALIYSETLMYAGYDDWRLPNVRELQSIVDYNHAPDARSISARGPAIDPVFNVTREESWYWTSTTHIENQFGYYVCFGQGLSASEWNGKPMNAHGAGAVRSDPKSGNPSDWKNGLGPQSDEIRIYNYVRCVRNIKK